MPILYLKGIPTGDFSEALAALLGKDAAGLSASAIGRLKDGWQDERAAWQKRNLPMHRYRAGRGVQVGQGRAEKLAPSRWSQPVAKTDSGCEVL